jgi:hypothetical protein
MQLVNIIYIIMSWATANNLAQVTIACDLDRLP